jgi:lipid-binding SYLF domain-containing protein
MIVPKEQLAKRPWTWLMKQGVFSDEEDFRGPQRVCDECSHSLRSLQPDLRLEVSRCNMQTVIDTSTYDDQYLPNMPQVDFQMENQISNACLMIHTSIKTGEQKVPSTILSMAKGVAFITILKVGFMVTGRYGSGVVLSRLPNGSWSAPSAITMSGVGWGIQVGTEVSDVLLVLTSDSAIEAFKSTGQLTVGAELGVSVGPVGKSLETDVTIGNKGAAHAFSYAASHGLYAGVSLEACVIAQAKGVNRAFYGERAHASALLAGDIAMPLGAEPLYKALDLLEYDGSPPAGREANRFIGYEKTRGALSSQASALGGGGGGGGGGVSGGTRAPQTQTQTQNAAGPPAGAAATTTTSAGSTGGPAAKIDYDTLGQVARFASDNPAIAGTVASMMTGSSSGGGTGSNSSSSNTVVGNT